MSRTWCNAYISLVCRYGAADIGEVSQLRQRHQHTASVLQQAEQEGVMGVQMAFVTAEKRASQGVTPLA